MFSIGLNKIKKELNQANSYEEWKTSMGGVLAADDIARTAMFMFEQPQAVNIRDVVISATRQTA